MNKHKFFLSNKYNRIGTILPKINFKVLVLRGHITQYCLEVSVSKILKIYQDIYCDKKMCIYHI